MSESEAAKEKDSSKYNKPYSVILQLRTNGVQDKAGRRKKPDGLLTFAHLSEKFLHVAVELLGQTQSLCKLGLQDEHYTFLWTFTWVHSENKLNWCM